MVSGLEIAIFGKLRVEENDGIELFILEILNIFSDTLVITGDKAVDKTQGLGSQATYVLIFYYMER